MVLVVFMALAVVGQLMNIVFCLALDHLINPTVSVLTFVPLYMAVFAGAWLLAVRIVERRESQPRALPHHGDEFARQQFNTPAHHVR